MNAEQIQHLYDLEIQHTKDYVALYCQPNNEIQVTEQSIRDAENRAIKLQVIEAAICAIQRQRIATINDFNVEHTAQIQVQLETLTNTLNERAQFIDKAVKQLEEFEGVRYQLQVIPAHYHGGNDIPKSEQLKSERDKLQNQLRQAKLATVSTSGVVTVRSPDELLPALCQLGEFVIGPPIAAVLHWIAEQTPRITERGNVMRSNNWRIRDVQPVFTVQWINGRFEAGKSSVQIEPIYHDSVDPHATMRALPTAGDFKYVSDLNMPIR